MVGGIVVASMITGAVMARQHADQVPTRRVPVLVELFTSEGCSSCPPADRLLASLAADQPVPGADIVVLSEHVDYWDRLGWRDPYSSAAFTERQRRYDLAVFRTGQIYTPQMIVGGHTQLIGSDREGALDAITRAAQAAPLVTIVLERRSDRVVVHAERPGGGHDVDVFLAVVEDGLTSQVRGGENAGRRLAHTAVTRRFATVGRMTGSQGRLDAEVPVSVEPAWNADRLRIVAFAQDGASSAVIGVGRVAWPRTVAWTGSRPVESVLY